MTINLKDRRKALGLTQKEVADYVGVSSTTVGRWESGEIKDMKRVHIKKLSEILSASPLEFLDNSVDDSDLSPATRLLLYTIKNASEDDIMKIVLVAQAVLK